MFSKLYLPFHNHLGWENHYIMCFMEKCFNKQYSCPIANLKISNVTDIDNEQEYYFNINNEKLRLFTSDYLFT